MRKILSVPVWFGIGLLFTLLLVVKPASALLELELTQGVSAAIPIAITSMGSPVAVPGNENFTDVIKNDLQNSGEFRVLGPDGLAQNPQTPTQVDTNYWKSQRVDNVLVGSVNSIGGGKYQVNFQLVGTYNTGAANNVILNGTFTTNSAGMRVLAHHISDLIYQKLIGVRGIFSTKIAYILVNRYSNGTAQYKLQVADVDGYNPQTLLTSSEPIMSPSWSPNGRQIAYVSFENHRSAIYLQNLASGGRRLISDAPGINGAPSFSPDGSQLALVLTKTDNPNIYLLNLNGGGLRTLINDWSIDTEPFFSADGKTLLFTSNRDGTPQVYSDTLSSGAIQRLTYRGDYNAKPSFSPDGSFIIVMHREDGAFGIARQDLSSGQMQILTQAGQDESPSVAPNGKMVIYATQYGGRGVLSLVSTDGRIKVRVPAPNGDVQEPAWSPFLN